MRAFAEACLAELGVSGSELSIVLCDDGRMRELNLEHRGMGRTTDVLAFSMIEGEGSGDGEMLGDVVISVDRCSAQAADLGIGFHEELARLLAHGICHLLGMDHVRGGPGAKKMFRTQEALVARFAGLLPGEA